MAEKARALTVTQLNEYAASIMAEDPVLRNVYMRGEVSNYKRTSAGHVYFSMKDEKSVINCVMFKSAAKGLDFELRDGLHISARGYVSVYAQEGRMQFYADMLYCEGTGDLHELFERRKNEYAVMGYFDSGRKKPLPFMPRAIGVVTSATGAVIHDICRVARRRLPSARIVLCPASVQGQSAAGEIARGIAMLDCLDEIDVIIIGRGGGSFEELFAFSEPEVVEAVFQANTPIIAAVGHETDFSLADFAADARASTPSAAAELAAPVKDELIAELGRRKDRMRALLLAKLALMESKNELLLSRCVASNPSKHMDMDRQKLEYITKRLHIAAYDVKAQLGRLDALDKRLANAAEANLGKKKLALEAVTPRLNAADPGLILKKGYAYIDNGRGIVRSARDLAPGERVRLVMSGGSAQAKIETVEVDA